MGGLVGERGKEIEERGKGKRKMSLDRHQFFCEPQQQQPAFDEVLLKWIIQRPQFRNKSVCHLQVAIPALELITEQNLMSHTKFFRFPCLFLDFLVAKKCRAVAPSAPAPRTRSDRLQSFYSGLRVLALAATATAALSPHPRQMRCIK